MPSTGLYQRIRRAMIAARDSWSDTQERIDPLTPDGYGAFSTRKVRYKFLTSVYKQDAFRSQAEWPTLFQPQFGLYKYIRDLFGIGFRLGEFYSTHLQGGSLDPNAGDGKLVPSALPIEMIDENPAVRAGIAELWKRSNWNIKKDLVSHLGSILGDVFIEAVDDPVRQRVRLNVVHPARVRDVEMDPEGNVKAYEYEWSERHPEDPRRLTTYRERCVNEGSRVVYQTFLENKLYAWPDNPFPGEAEWSTAFGFIPLVKVEHKDVGVGWGQAEVEAAVAGWRELADLGSCMTDWSRRALHSPHLISGMTKPTATEIAQAARDESQYIWASSQNASTKSLLVPLPVGELVEYLKLLLQHQKDDYPEIALQVLQQSGISGESIRRAREPAQAKVFRRRGPYNAATERILKMGLTMGGVLGYEGFQGITLESFGRGEMDFRIGGTPMMGSDPLDVIEEKNARWLGVKTAVDAGVPLESVMEDYGFSAEEIAVTARRKAVDTAAATQRQRELLAGDGLVAEDDLDDVEDGGLPPLGNRQ